MREKQDRGLIYRLEFNQSLRTKITIGIGKKEAQQS